MGFVPPSLVGSAPRRTRVTPTPRFSAGLTAGSTSRDRGAPERLSLNTALPNAIQFGAELPVRSLETPIAIADRAVQGITGVSPVDQLAKFFDKTPVGDVSRFLEGVVNYPGAIGGANFRQQLIDARNKPLDAKVNPYLTDFLGNLVFGNHSFDVPIQTVGDLYAEAGRRGYSQQDISELQSGLKGIFDFGEKALSTDPLANIGLNIAFDPLTYFGGIGLLKSGVRAGAGAAARLAASPILEGVGVLGKVRSAGLYADKAITASESVAAIAKGNLAGATNKGMGLYLTQAARTYAKVGVRTYLGLEATTAVAGAAAEATKDTPVAGFFENLHEIGMAYLDRRPISRNAFASLVAATYTPVIPLGGEAVKKVKSEWRSAVGDGTFQYFRSQLGTVAAGKLDSTQLSRLIDHLDAKIVMERFGNTIENSVGNLANDAVRLKALNEVVRTFVSDARKNGTITNEQRWAKFTEWSGELGGFAEKSKVRMALDPVVAVEQWARYLEAIAPMQRAFYEYGKTIGYSDILTVQNLSDIRAIVAAKAKGGSVGIQDVRRLLALYPQIMSGPRYKDWERYGLASTTDVSVRELNRKLDRLNDIAVDPSLGHELDAAERGMTVDDPSVGPSRMDIMPELRSFVADAFPTLNDAERDFTANLYDIVLGALPDSASKLEYLRRLRTNPDLVPSEGDLFQKAYDINPQEAERWLAKPEVNEAALRLKDYIDPTRGAPAQPSRVNGPDATHRFGQVTPEEWYQMVLATGLKPGMEEFRAARHWYRDLNEMLDRILGRFFPDKTFNVKIAWILTQVRTGPSEGMMQVLKVLDPIKRLKAAGTDDQVKKLTDAVNGFIVASGQKINDFTDSFIGKRTRTLVLDDPRGGMPAAADTWAARDVGFVDPATQERFPDAGEKDLKDNGSLNRVQYEYIVNFYNRAAEWLNANNIDGGGWTAAEAQALGWTRVQRAFGVTPEMPSDIFNKNMMTVATDIGAGEGSRLEKVVPSVYDLDRAKGMAIMRDHFGWLIPEIAKLTGVKVDSTFDGLGMYRLFKGAPSTVLRLFGAKAQVQDFMDVLGYANFQTDIFGTRLLASGKTPGIDIISAATGRLTDPDEVQRFWDRLIEVYPNLAHGAQPMALDGNSGLRILEVQEWVAKNDLEFTAPDGSVVRIAKDEFIPRELLGGAEFKDWKKQKSIERTVLPWKEQDAIAAINQVSDEFGFNVELRHDTYENLVAHNDWKVNPDGRDLKQALHARGAGAIAERLDDLQSASEANLKRLYEQHAPEELAAFRAERGIVPGSEFYQRADDFHGTVKGLTRRNPDGTVSLRGLDGADFSTATHELWHAYELLLPEEMRADLDRFGDAEVRARAFERYMRQGQAPVPELQSFFDRAKEWMVNIYRTIRGTELAKPIHPELKAYFDETIRRGYEAKAQETAPIRAALDGTSTGPKVARGTTLDEVLAGLGTPRDEQPLPRVMMAVEDGEPIVPEYARGVRRLDIKAAREGRLITQEYVMNQYGNAVPVPGTEKPLDYVYRAVSEEDWQNIQQTGVVQSDGRMNLGADEGTVAADRAGNTTFYLPGNLASNDLGDYPGRILKIRVDPADGWRVDARGDSYIKTQSPIPLDRVEMISPKITTSVVDEASSITGKPIRTRNISIENAALDAAVAEELAPVYWHKSLQDTDQGVLDDLAANQRYLQENFPGYTIKTAPKIATLIDPVNGLEAQALTQYTTLGNWLYGSNIFSPLTRMIAWALRPVDGGEQAKAARQAMFSELAKYGAKPDDVARMLAQLSEDTRRFVVGSNKVRMFRDYTHIPAGTINDTASKVFSTKVYDAVMADGGFANVLDQASNTFIRSLLNKDDKLSTIMERMYGRYQKSNFGKALRYTKVFYHLFRFQADPRWWAMNLLEADTIGFLRYGTKATFLNGDYISPQMATQMERHPITEKRLAGIAAELKGDVDNTFLLHRNLAGRVSGAFDSQRMGNAQGVVNKVLEDSMDEVVAKGLDAITDVPMIRALIDQFGGDPKTWAAQLDEQLYRFDTSGVKKTVLDATEELGWDPETVTRLAPVMARLEEVNTKTLEDIKTAFMGNAKRTNFERLLNSYWLYWPLSYQLKAGKWLADVLTSGAVGKRSNFAGLWTYNRYREQHIDRMENDPQYAAMFNQYPSLWFAAQMLFPIYPEDLGVSLSRPVRYMGGYVGLWPEYKQAQDPFAAANSVLEIGPIYTFKLLSRIRSEMVREDATPYSYAGSQQGAFYSPLFPGRTSGQ